MPDQSNRFCSQCGASIRVDAKFCSACGTPVQKTEIAAEEAGETTPPPIPLEEEGWRYSPDSGWSRSEPTPTPSPPPQPKKSGTAPVSLNLRGCVIVACVLFGAVLLVSIIGRNAGPRASHPASPVASATSTPSTASATPATSTSAPSTAQVPPIETSRTAPALVATSTPESNATPTPPPLSAEDQAFADSGGRWIKTDTWGGRSKEDLSELMNMALSDDIAAQAGMVREGRAVVLKQGQHVQLQEVAIFGGMEKVRLVGETKSWWINLSHSSKTPVMTHEEKLSAVQAPTLGIAQTPLTGNLSAVKLFLGQPLTAWKKAYPSGKPTLLNPSAYNFNAGRFIITVSFDTNSGLANHVLISEAEGKAPLTVKEATQIATSIGLTKNPVKDAEYPSYLNWNNEGDPLSAYFDTDKDERALTIKVKP